METIFDVGKIALQAAGVALSEREHRQSMKLGKDLHDKSIKLASKLHNQSIQTEKRTYLMETFTDIEQHFQVRFYLSYAQLRISPILSFLKLILSPPFYQQLNADLISSSKESERDMFDQRNQSFQTIILSASVMFGSLSTVIIQG